MKLPATVERHPKPFVPGGTARVAHCAIDEIDRHATVTLQWLLENEDAAGTHPITAKNAIDMLICGQEGFAAIAADLDQARAGVDLVGWAFDPAMELVRGAGADWPRGETFGDVLRRIATRRERPVKVRLMVWSTIVGTWVQKNLPGYAVWQPARPGLSEQEIVHSALKPLGLVPGSAAARRAQHCIEWWRWALNPANAHLVEVRLRSGDTQAVKDAARHNPGWSALDMSERALMAHWPTHHQKTVLVDYHHEEGAHAVGYVMGFNSLTSYWDTREHLFNDARRERVGDAPPLSIERQTAVRVGRAGGDATDVRLDPLHDYGCRLRGQALQWVHLNFQTAWLRTGAQCETRVPTRLAEAVRYRQGSRVQVVRTQPQENDHTIRDLYFHVTEQARNYLYLENQYFQFAEWAEHLRATRKKHRAFYKKAMPTSKPADPNILHLFIVIPRPEKAGMVPRTFDTLERLGSSALMHEENLDGEDVGAYYDVVRARDARLEAERRMEHNTYLGKQRYEMQVRPQLDALRQAEREQQPTPEDLEAEGLRVLVAMPETFDDGSSGLRSKVPADKYRQIYIHSKLLIVDDSVFTVGSANMNMRSMAVDSEINIVTDDPVKTRELRKDVWGLYTGGLFTGGEGGPLDIEKTFKQWKFLIKENDLNKKKGMPLTGFLCTFHDSQRSRIRVA